MAIELVNPTSTLQEMRDRMACRPVAPQELALDLDESNALADVFDDEEAEGILDDHAEAINALGAAFDALIASLVEAGLLAAAPEE